MIEEIEFILTHEWFLVFYGVLVWTVVEYARAMRKKDFVFREWWRLERVEFAIAMMIAPLVIAFDDDYLIPLYNQILNTNYEIFEPWMYLGIGFFIDAIISFLNKKL